MRSTSARIRRPTTSGRSNTGVGGTAKAKPQFRSYGRHYATAHRLDDSCLHQQCASPISLGLPAVSVRAIHHMARRTRHLLQGRSPASLSQAMLAAHNAVRSRVGVPPLVWSAQLAEVARDWANHLITTGSFSHRPDNSYGENLYSISGGTASPAQVVGYWAEEAHGYDLRSNTCAGVCGHYTQIVWAHP